MNVRRMAIAWLFMTSIACHFSVYSAGISRAAMSEAYHTVKETVIKATKQALPMLLVEGLVLGVELFFNRVRAGAYGARNQTIPVPAPVPDDRGHIAPETVSPVIQGIIRLINEPDRLRRTGAKMWKGILLTGSPGIGKSDLGFYIARQTGALHMYKSASELIEQAQGSGAQAVRLLFDRVYEQSIWARFKGFVTSIARRILRRRQPEQKPVVLILDEIDAIGCSRRHVVTDQERAREAERVRALEQLLTEIDGAYGQDLLPKVFVVGTTNRPIRRLDEALWRPGRLSPLQVPLLNRADREAVFRFRAARYPLPDHVNFARLASKTEGFSGAAVSDLLNTAALHSAVTGHPQVRSHDFALALNRHKAIYGQPSRRTRLMR